MKNDPGQQEEFAQLRTLLKIKRHEQPPPGYFHRFPDQVRARIELEVVEAGGYHRWTREAWWPVRFLRSLETNPIFAAAFGAAVCGLMVCGVVYAQYTPKELAGDLAQQSDGSGTQDGIGVATSFAQTAFDRSTAYSTNVILSAGFSPSPFEQALSLRATPVTYQH